MRSLLFIVVAIMMGCSAPEQRVDQPTIGIEMTVENLRKTAMENPMLITENYYIKGHVSANDDGGNFFKSFVVEGIRGGIEVLAGFYSICDHYPVGREVTIYLRGLTLMTHNGTLQVGLAEYQDAPSYFHYPNMLRKYIDRGYTMCDVKPVTLALNEISTRYLGSLIEVQGLSAPGVTSWMNSNNEEFFILYDNDSSAVALEISPYSDIWGKIVPTEPFSVRGILYWEEIKGVMRYVIKPRNIDDVE